MTEGGLLAPWPLTWEGCSFRGEDTVFGEYRSGDVAEGEAGGGRCNKEGTEFAGLVYPKGGVKAFWA